MSLLTTEAVDVNIAGKRVVRDFSFTLSPGQVWGMIGANGVGKTTLLHSLAGLRAVDAGHVQLRGKYLTRLSRRQIACRLGLVAQHTVDQFGASVRETVLMGRHPWIAPMRGESRNDYRIADEVLAETGLADLAERRVDELSGGERRRVAVATLLCQTPDVYLLDEPTNHLDLNHQFDLLDTVVRRARDQDAGVVTILHDVNLVSRFCTHAMLLYGDGEAKTGRTSELLGRENLGRLYGRPVIDTVVDGRRVFVPS